MVQSLVGNVLVASTLINEPMFAHGVCLMMHHDEQGAVAVMLNRPINPSPSELVNLLLGQTTQGEDGPKANVKSSSRLPQTANLPSTPLQGNAAGVGMIHFGGPLSGPVVAIHRAPGLAEAQTAVGIYVAAQREHLEQLVRENPGDFRLIIGHTGWPAGQLDAEIDAGFWHVLPATADMVFQCESDLWPLLVRRATGTSVARWVGAEGNSVAFVNN